MIAMNMCELVLKTIPVSFVIIHILEKECPMGFYRTVIVSNVL